MALEKPLEGLHIIVDAGNGAGGFFVVMCYTYLGLFPNHIPNPEDKTAMMSITQAVLDNKADLGIIFISQFAVAIPYQFPSMQ